MVTSPISLAKQIYNNMDVLEDIYWFAREDITGSRQYNVSYPTRIRAWTKGFHSKTWVWLNPGGNSEKYINNIQQRRVIKNINEEYQSVLNDGIAFYNSTQQLDTHIPKYHGVVVNGDFSSLSDENVDLESIVESNSDLIFKPISGSQGEGIYRIRKQESGIQINSELVSEEQFRDFVHNLDEYLISDFIHQHTYSSKIFDGSVNTIRFLTVIDPQTNVPEIIRAVHRFGTSESRPTDNWSRGGICAPIDLDTGELGAVYGQGDQSIERGVSHPETGEDITGVQIPIWGDVCNVVRDFASHHFRANYVGWDVVVTEDNPVVIEANSNPGINIIQLENGLLENETVRRFLTDS